MATVKGIDILGVFNSLREDKKLVITDNVFDDVQGKFQDKINKEIIEKEAENRSVISRIKSEVEAFIGPETNYLGIVGSTASLPTDKAPAWCLVADPDEGIAKVKVYILPYGTTAWGVFTDTTYDFTDFTEVEEKVTRLVSKVGDLDGNFVKVTNDGFFLTDANGNIALQIGADGKIDVIGIGRNLTSEIFESLNSFKTTSDGFFLTDVNGNVVFKIDDDGRIDAIGLGKNLTSTILEVLNSFKASSDGFFITDEQGNVAARVDANGKFDVMAIGNKLRQIITDIASQQGGGGGVIEGVRTSSLEPFRNADGSVKSFTLSLSNIGRSVPMILHSRAYYEGSAAPTLTYSVGAFTSIKFDIGGKGEYASQSWRIPPILDGMTAKIVVSVPSGTSLIIKDFATTYEYGIPSYGGVRLDAHLGFQSFAPENSMPAYEYAAICGYPGCIVNPIASADGVLMCYHQDAKRLSLDGGITTVALSDTDFKKKTYQQLLEYDVVTNSTMGSLFPSAKIPKLEDFFALCARTGMRPMFSTHPALTEAEWREVKMLLVKYGILDRMTVKAFDVDILRSAFAVLGNDIDAYIYDVAVSDTSASVSKMNALKSDGCTTRMGIENDKTNVSQSNVKTIIDGGYFASVWNIFRSLTASQYKEMMLWGVTEFTDDNNCCNGLNW